MKLCIWYFEPQLYYQLLPILSKRP